MTPHRVLVCSNAGHDHHDTGASHPERPERMAAVSEGIADVRRLAGEAASDESSVDFVTASGEISSTSEMIADAAPRRATIDELARVHDSEYLRALETLCVRGGGHLDPDTAVSPGSWETALFAAGAGLSAVDALSTDAADAAFVAVRPPGHHALALHGMGFCLFNNIAVTAASLTARGERVLIVDWDAHHGNGTQDIFWDDPDVLFVSSHQYPFYPGTGAADETGGADALGATINVPLPAFATGDAILRTFDDVVAGVVESFDPTWVLVSAGFDAHRDDPLTTLGLTDGDFAALARRVLEFAPRRGRCVLFLEGGYDPGALRRSVASTIGVLADVDVTTESPTSGGPGREVAALVGDTRRHLVGDV